MLEVRDEAVEHLMNMLTEGSQGPALRIAVMGGSSGPRLGLIVDEKSDDDVSLTCKNIPFIIEQKLFEYCQTITIGFQKGRDGSCGGSSGSGFLIHSTNPL